MSDIPPGIITEILVRLPVKSLLRFRCVFQPWRSLIDGDYFIKLHLRHSDETNSNRTLIVETSKSGFGFDVDPKEPICVELDSLERLDAGNTRIVPGLVVSPCNGLALIMSDISKLVLWNPSTREFYNLSALGPLPPEFLRIRDDCRKGGQVTLGYDSKHDDYKVFRRLQACNRLNGTCLYSETRIYSLKTDSWKMLEDFPYMLGKKTWSVCVNDAFHTVIERNSSNSSSAVLIMAFDLATEEHYEVPTPELSGVGCNLDRLAVIGGCLAAVFGIGVTNHSIEVWAMKKYGVKGSWQKLLRFDPPVPEPRAYLQPLAYSKSFNEVLLNYNRKRLIWYNLVTKAVSVVEGLTLSSVDSSFATYFCVASLVSPYGAGKKIGKKKDKKRDDFLSVGFKLVL